MRKKLLFVLIIIALAFTAHAHQSGAIAISSVICKGEEDEPILDIDDKVIINNGAVMA